jgi:hypothetical protein
MKIRFLKPVAVDVEDSTGEIYDKSFNKWDELEVEAIFEGGMKFATLKTEQGIFLHGVPVDSFEKLKEAKREVVL